MAIERYSGTELSLERAVARIEPEHREAYRAAYEWLAADAGTRGPRPLGKRAPQGMEVRLVAERGIHKPGGRPYALTISSAGTSTYANDAVHRLDDGTWLLQYCAHRRNAGEKMGSPEYNESLRRCLREGLPVGVFLKDGGSWLHLGLAFVEKYDSELDMFWLHGPVDYEMGSGLSPYPPAGAVEYDSGSWEGRPDGDGLKAIADKLPPESDERDRVVAEIVRRKGQAEFRRRLVDAYGGRCAISRYDVEPALEAAHISSYLGPKSQLVTNGLLLRTDLHALYDRSLITVSPELRVRISPKIGESKYASLDGRQLAVPKDRAAWPSEERLAAQYQDFLIANSLNG